MSRWSEAVTKAAPYLWWRYNAAGNIDASGNGRTMTSDSNATLRGQAPSLIYGDSDGASDYPVSPVGSTYRNNADVDGIVAFGFWAKLRSNPSNTTVGLTN